MREIHKQLRETFNRGPDTVERFVHYGQSASLAKIQIEAVGQVIPQSGFEMIRMKTKLPIIHVTVEGTGEVLVGGKWERITEGKAYLMPAGKTSGYRLGSSEYWRAVWVIGQDPSLIDSEEPVVRATRGLALESAVVGLVNEFFGECSQDLMAIWADLVKAYALKIGRPSEFEGRRLQKVWEHVEADLGRNWQLADLADLACMSEESVRRICKRQLGKSPIEYVTGLRMKSAAALLHMYPYSIEQIAHIVGYGSAYSFSSAFKKWSGKPPSQFRAEGVSDNLLADRNG